MTRHPLAVSGVGDIIKSKNINFISVSFAAR